MNKMSVLLMSVPLKLSLTACNGCIYIELQTHQNTIRPYLINLFSVDLMKWQKKNYAYFNIINYLFNHSNASVAEFRALVSLFFISWKTIFCKYSKAAPSVSNFFWSFWKYKNIKPFLKFLKVKQSQWLMHLYSSLSIPGLSLLEKLSAPIKCYH